MFAHGFKGGASAGFGFEECIGNDADIGAGLFCEVKQCRELLEGIHSFGCCGVGLADEFTRAFDDGEGVGDRGGLLFMQSLCVGCGEVEILW